MLYDAKDYHPADAGLAAALRNSFTQALSETDYVYHLMRAAEAERPGMIGGESITDPSHRPYKFIPPEQVLVMRETLDKSFDAILEDVAKAATLEEQESLLLETMSDTLNTAQLSGAHSQTAVTLMASIELAFTEYRQHGASMSRELINVGNSIKYYAGICYETIACSEALILPLQQREIEATSHYAPDPYSLAMLRRERAMPRLADAPAMVHDESLVMEAKQVYLDMIEPYLDVLPRPLNVQMMGLILRCTERVAPRVVGDEEMARAKAKFRINTPANDEPLPCTLVGANARATLELLEHPLIRRRVRSILGQVFLQHTETAESPTHTMEASMALEEALVREESRLERGR